MRRIDIRTMRCGEGGIEFGLYHLGDNVSGTDKLVQDYIKFLYSNEVGGLYNIIKKTEPDLLPDGMKRLAESNVPLHRQMIYAAVSRTNQRMIEYMDAHEEGDIPDEGYFVSSVIKKVDINPREGYIDVEIELTTRSGLEVIGI